MQSLGEGLYASAMVDVNAPGQTGAELLLPEELLVGFDPNNTDPCAVEQVNDGAYADGARVTCDHCLFGGTRTVVENDDGIAVIMSGNCPY